MSNTILTVADTSDFNEHRISLERKLSLDITQSETIVYFISSVTPYESAIDNT